MAERWLFHSRSPQETQRLGEALGRHARAGDLLLLKGGLGTGKTTLVQGIARGMRVEGYAHSPTFVLVHEHRGPLRLVHVDLYRINDPLEVVDMGIEEYLEAGGVCVVEWAEKGLEVFPRDHLLVELEAVGEEERRITLRPGGPGARRLLTAARRERAQGSRAASEETT